jgi:hypothetical protein
VKIGFVANQVCALFGRRKRRQQQTRKHGDDGNHHQQFNQRKSANRMSIEEARNEHERIQSPRQFFGNVRLC